MSTAASSNRKWKIALVAAIVTGPLLGALGTAWAVQTFPDVPPTHTFYEEIEWGAANGITNGFNDGTFRPGEPVTRGASVAMLANYNDAIHLVTSSVNPPPSTGWIHEATCPAGERAIGGSADTSGSHIYISETSIDGPTYSVTWFVANGEATDLSRLTVIAVCAPDAVANPITGSGAPAFDKLDE